MPPVQKARLSYTALMIESAGAGLHHGRGLQAGDGSSDMYGWLLMTIMAFMFLYGLLFEIA